MKLFLILFATGISFAPPKQAAETHVLLLKKTTRPRGFIEYNVTGRGKSRVFSMTDHINDSIDDLFDGSQAPVGTSEDDIKNLGLVEIQNHSTALMNTGNYKIIGWGTQEYVRNFFSERYAIVAKPTLISLQNNATQLARALSSLNI